MPRSRRYGQLAVTSLLLLSTSCTLVPDEGPTTSQVMRGAKDAKIDFRVVELTDHVADYVTTYEDSRTPPLDLLMREQRRLGGVGPGDVLHISVWEPNQTGTTLLDRASLELTTQVTDEGTISVPYAGTIQATGRTPSQIARAIESTLRTQVATAQAAVFIQSDVTNTVMV